MGNAGDRARKLNREWAETEGYKEQPGKLVFQPHTPEDFLVDARKLKLNVHEFRAAFRAGAFKSILLKGGGGHFEIFGEPRTPRRNLASAGEWLMLATTKGKKDRTFRNPETALELLCAMGVTEVRVELEHWHPTRVKEWARKRPDMAERLRFAHECARAGDFKNPNEGGDATPDQRDKGEGASMFLADRDHELAREGDFDWPEE
jgi:hypothetical protein